MALATGTIGTVVATLGTTSLGAVDPLPAILDRARAHGARVILHGETLVESADKARELARDEGFVEVSATGSLRVLRRP